MATREQSPGDGRRRATWPWSSWRRTREQAATYWYDNVDAGKGGPIPDHTFNVQGSLLSTEHLAVTDHTKEEALDRLRQRQHALQTELKKLNEFLALAQACTDYHSHSDDDEDSDFEIIDDDKNIEKEASSGQ